MIKESPISIPFKQSAVWTDQKRLKASFQCFNRHGHHLTFFFFFYFGNDNLPMSVLKCLIGIPPSTCQIPLSTFLTFLPLQSLPATVMVSEQNLDMLLSYQYMQWKCYGKKNLVEGIVLNGPLGFLNISEQLILLYNFCGHWSST